MHHRSLAVVITIALLVGGSAATVTVDASSHATIELTGPGSVEPGDTVTVTANIDTDTPVYGAQFRLSLSTPVSGSVEKGDFLAGNASSAVVVREVSETTVRYGETRTGVDDGVTGSGTLARIELTVPESSDADQLDLSFETVKVSDPNAQPINASGEGLSMTIGASEGTSGDGSEDADDADAGGSDSGAGGGGEASGSADGATTVTPTDSWPASVSVTVVERFETAERLPVVVTVDPDADPTAVAGRFESSGATGVRVQGDLNAVSATVSEETLRTVASRSDVVRVQYGSPTTPTATGGEASGTTAATPAVTGTADATPAAESTATATLATGTASTQFDIFGQPAILLAAVVVVIGFLWWRRLR